MSNSASFVSFTKPHLNNTVAERFLDVCSILIVGVHNLCGQWVISSPLTPPDRTASELSPSAPNPTLHFSSHLPSNPVSLFAHKLSAFAPAAPPLMNGARLLPLSEILDHAPTSGYP
jgi:hypothetical protein